MKTILIGALVCTVFIRPTMVKSQIILDGSERVNNIYRRDSAVIHDYNIEFAKRIKKADSVTDGDVVIAHISKPYKGNRNLENIRIHVQLSLEARDNRSRLKFGQVTYIAEKGECPLSGTMTELRKSKKCSYYASQIKDDYTEFVTAIYNEYKSFLKEKSHDGNW